MNKNLMILGAPACPSCNALKADLERKGVPFTYVNVTDPADPNFAEARAQMASKGLRGLPIAFLRGTLVGAGDSLLNHDFSGVSDAN